MGRSRHYTPPLHRELVSRLYWEAKARQVPMTVLLNRMVREALDRVAPVPEPLPGVAEEPPTTGSAES